MAAYPYGKTGMANNELWEHKADRNNKATYFWSILMKTVEYFKSKHPLIIFILRLTEVDYDSIVNIDTYGIRISFIG